MRCDVILSRVEDLEMQKGRRHGLRWLYSRIVPSDADDLAAVGFDGGHDCCSVNGVAELQNVNIILSCIRRPAAYR